MVVGILNPVCSFLLFPLALVKFSSFCRRKQKAIYYKNLAVCQMSCRVFLHVSLHLRYLCIILKLINYSCYPTRASYSGQVDEFRNPMKNKLKTRPCLKPMFEIISKTDANFLNLHIDKATKTRGAKQLYLITHFTRHTLNLNYLLPTLNITLQLLN